MAQNKKQSITENLPPVSKLIDFVQYQDDAVVSKTLLDTKAETVTVFAFAAGQGLSEHTSPFEAITIDGKTIHLKAGEMVTMPSNTPHALQAIKKFKMMLVMQRV
jgi:quercetin dioxygenase-like cupin family protein